MSGIIVAIFITGIIYVLVASCFRETKKLSMPQLSEAYLKTNHKIYEIRPSGLTDYEIYYKRISDNIWRIDLNSSVRPYSSFEDAEQAVFTKIGNDYDYFLGKVKTEERASEIKRYP